MFTSISNEENKRKKNKKQMFHFLSNLLHSEENKKKRETKAIWMREKIRLI